jgi:membrane-bound lytic murein transglycosylase D
LRKYDDELAGISGDSLFFALADQDYLRAETRNYVPQIIAAALIGKDPARYGVRVDTQPPFAFDTVRVPGLTPVAAVAAAAGCEVAEVTALNPHLLRGITPAGASWLARVPAGSGPGFAERFAGLDTTSRAAWRVVKTRKGETPTSFASRVGVSVTALDWFGPKPARAAKGRLVAGQAVKVPTLSVMAASRSVPDPSIERYGPTPKGRRMHVVRRGESLGRIAQRYGTTTKALMRLNGLRKPVVYAGQSLLVRGSASSRARVSPQAGAKVKSKVAKQAATRKAAAGRATARQAPTKKAAPASQEAASSVKRTSGRQSMTPRPR